MSLALAQVSNHLAAVFLGVQGVQLYSDGHRGMGITSFILGVALLAGFYAWSFIRQLKEDI